MAETGGYSLSDFAAVTRGNEDGMFGGGSALGILVLLFLFMGFLGRGGLWGNNAQEVMSKVGVDAATQSQVSDLSSRVSQDAILGAISGNKDAINSLAQNLCCSTNTITQAITAASNMSQQSFSQLSANVAQCCCTIRSEMAQGFNGLNTMLLTQTNGLNTTLLQGFNGVDKAMCSNGYAMSQGFNNINNALVSGFAQIGYQAAQNTNQIIQSNEKNADKILQWLTTSQISELQTKLSDAKSEISQANQTAAILAAIRGNGCPCNNTSCGCANSSCC